MPQSGYGDWVSFFRYNNVLQHVKLLAYEFGGTFPEHIDAYRRAFVPSPRFAAPHALLGVAALCAPTADEAEWLAGGMDLAWARLRSGVYAPLPTPEEAAAHAWTESERQLVRHFRQLVIVGTPGAVAERIAAKAAACQASEVMIACNLHGHEARLRSYRLIAEAFGAPAA